MWFPASPRRTGRRIALASIRALVLFAFAFLLRAMTVRRVIVSSPCTLVSRAASPRERTSVLCGSRSGECADIAVFEYQGPTGTGVTHGGLDHRARQVVRSNHLVR